MRLHVYTNVLNLFMCDVQLKFFTYFMHVKQIGPYQISNRNGRGGGAVGKSGPTSGRLDVREFQPRQT